MSARRLAVLTAAGFVLAAAWFLAILVPFTFTVAACVAVVVAGVGVDLIRHGLQSRTP